MADFTQASFTSQDLDRLQRLRTSILAFQNMIAPLAANTSSNAHSEQFNQLRLEAKALLKDSGFDKKVARAVTEDVLVERSQKVVFPRLAAVGILGVILALAGLGVNSIVFEEPIVNGLACCVSSGGMLLVIGAFVVWGVVNTRRRVSNLGDLYLRCDTLLYQVEHALNLAIPGFASRPAGELPVTPSVVELSLDSLHKQAADWQHKLHNLEGERLALQTNAPLELGLTIDFVQRELNRVQQEIERLQGRFEAAEPAESFASSPPEVPAPPRVIVPAGTRPEEVDPVSLRRARSDTIDMPPARAIEPDEVIPAGDVDDLLDR